MKKQFVILVIVAAMLSQCGLGNKHDINVKRDFEYMYNVIEKSFLTLDKGIKQKRINKSLDAIEAYIAKEEPKIKAVGVRLNSIILKEKESYEIIKFNEKYAKLGSKYLSYFERNVNSKQKDRFVEAVVVGVAKKFTDQLLMPKNSIDFFKKAIR